MILRKNLTLTAIDRRDNDSGNSDSISISIPTGLLSLCDDIYSENEVNK